jgi:hypothetical protein
MLVYGLKLAEFPQNETIFDRIIAEFLVKIASTGQLISELVTRASELFTRAMFAGLAPFSLDSRHFRWTRAISIDSRPAPYRLSQDF